MNRNQMKDMGPRMQNTHWYNTGHGFTSNPIYAQEGEIERAGLHDCQIYSCEGECVGSAQWYYRELLQAAEFAKQSESDDWAKELWGEQEGLAYRRSLLRESKSKRCVVRL